jgi:S1-C subfamily serine protease
VNTHQYPAPRHLLQPLRRLCVLVVLSLWGALAGVAAQAARAQVDDELPAAAAQALARASSAVVGLEVEVVEGARTAASLGERRVGSGVLIDDNGLVLTIGYLMVEAEAVQIVTLDHKSFPARVIAYDPVTGFGLVRSLLPLHGIKPVTLGSSADLTEGQQLVVVTGRQSDGTPPGVAGLRLISKRAFSGSWEYHLDSAIFTVPAVTNHSGAALFNHQGELVGIGSLYVRDVLGRDGLLPGNMYVPVDLLRPILAELQRDGASQASHRPWLGLTSAELRGRVQVLRVGESTPAEMAGLSMGDVILAVDGVPVSTLESFYKKLWAHTGASAPIRLTVQQGQEVKTLLLPAVERASFLKRPEGI